MYADGQGKHAGRRELRRAVRNGRQTAKVSVIALLTECSMCAQRELSVACAGETCGALETRGVRVPLARYVRSDRTLDVCGRDVRCLGDARRACAPGQVCLLPPPTPILHRVVS